MNFDGFVGGSYTALSPNLACDRSVNLYVEASESSVTEKSPRFLLGAPGLAVVDTLPTTPVRGIWTGLEDTLPGSTGSDLAYAVGGSKLYQLFSNGTHSLIGDVGDDAAHSPVTFQANPTQLIITSAGVLWVWDGTTLTQSFFNNGLTTVNTAGTAVTWVSGDQFDETLVGFGVLIAGVAYVVAAYVDPTHITLATSAGTQTSADAVFMAGSGTLNVAGHQLTWVSGSTFRGLVHNSPIIIWNGGIDGDQPTVYGINVADPLYPTIGGGSLPASFGVKFSCSAPVAAAMSAALDTYVVALPADSTAFNISSPNDAKKWNPLDFGRKEGFPDAIAAVLADHEELWLFGSETTEVWRDTGASDFPLQRDPGAFIHQGIRAPFSAVSLANSVAWIGGDARGGPIAWRATGYTPTRVSTHAVETAWASYSTVTDATAFVLVVRGHQFWVINFPSGNATWVYDATSGLWHERAWWNTAANGGAGGFDRHRAGCHGYAFGKYLVGDWQNGKIYDYSEAYFSDFGGAIVYERTAPHLSNEELWTYYSRFRISMKAGPTPTLAWSDDLGQTFNAPRDASNRSIGTATQMSEWRRLGRAKDRAFRMRITSTTDRIAIAAAYVDASNGGG